MQIRPHHDQIKRFKRLHLLAVVSLGLSAVLLTTISKTAAIVLLVAAIPIVLILYAFTMRRCACANCGQTLTLPMGFRVNRSEGPWEYECRDCNILWTVKLEP